MTILKQNLSTRGVAGTILLFWAGCAEPVPEKTFVKPVKAVVLGRSEEGGGRLFPGTVQAAQRARLSFRVSGPLVQLPIFEGKEVRRGELLAQVDPRDYETAVRNLEARLADLRAQLRAMEVARPEDIRSLEANLAAARSRLLEAGATFRRYQRLYENDNVSKAEYDQRRAARDVAEAEVRTAEESLNIARAGARAEDIEAMKARIRAMEAELARARDQLNDTSLRAPYDGRVAERYVENFEYVRAQEEILSLQDTSTVEIVAQIPESIVARGRREQIPEFLVRFESLPGQQFPAEATEIATEADPVTRTYAVTFQTPQPPEGRVFSGMTAEVLLRQRIEAESVFTVPVSSIFADEQGAQYVWVLDQQSMTPEKARVRVGDLIGDSAMVLEGLEAGDTVITAGTHAIIEGQQVRLITDELRERR